ncbi:MAG TPA: hypothetical protein VJZ73_18410 [Methylomirabilota bacterium]|nr:hypothetical protein [Methylomirabilota bacterium]
MQNGERSILIVVPRTGQDACRSLSHTFAEDSTVEVIVDRRLADRRAGNGAHRPERRQSDRRIRLEGDAELKVDRWFAVARPTTTKVDFDDPDSKAILFLCCSQHIVPCQRCQNTYRLGWIPRSELGVFPCPLCGSDLTEVVTAHAQVCSYWVNRQGVKRPLSRAGVGEPPAQAATG